MTKNIIMALLCFVAQKLSAQPTNTDTIVSLNSSLVAEAPAIPIAGIKIATALPDTTTVGYIGKASQNATFRLIPSTAYTTWLQTFVESKYKNVFNNSGRQLVWVVKNLSISKDTAGNNIFVRLKADVASSTANNKFLLTSTVDTAIVATGSKTNYSLAIEEAIRALFTVSANNNTPISTDPLTLNDLISGAQQVYNIPILKENRYKRGVYTTFEEFKNNSPSITDMIVKSGDKGSSKVYQMLADSTFKEISNPWGICIANEQYAYTDGELIPIERSANNIVVSRFQKPEIRQNQAIYYRNLMSNNADNDNPFDRKRNKKAKRKVKNVQAVATRIDIETGELTF
jgi:hypothetical protein